jgi:hypothetical protein
MALRRTGLPQRVLIRRVLALTPQVPLDDRRLSRRYAQAGFRRSMSATPGLLEDEWHDVNSVPPRRHDLHHE